MTVDAHADACGDWSGRTPIRTMFLGNSQVEFWELHRLVAVLSASAPAACPRIEGLRFSRGGANLGDLLRGGSGDGLDLVEELSSGRYDAVVIAESIDLASIPGYSAAFRADATDIIALARQHGVVPLLYATPFVETPDNAGFQEMADPQIQLGAELGVRVAAGGLTWLRVWSSQPDVDLFHSDRAHPGYRGSYLSRLVIYAALTGASPIGLAADTNISCDGGPCPPIEANLVPVFQRAALEQHQATGR